MSRFLWMVVQAAVIIGLTWDVHLSKPDEPIAVYFILSAILVAFLTACLTRLWDWLFAPGARASRAVILSLWVGFLFGPMAVAILFFPRDERAFSLAFALPVISALLWAVFGRPLWGWARWKVAGVEGGVGLLDQPEADGLSRAAAGIALPGELPQQGLRPRIGKDPG